MNIAWATGYYGSPWSGRGGATPVIEFPPGRYRVSDTITVPTGATVRGAAHPANTTSHTRIIMDSPSNTDNRNKAIFRFNRVTLDGSTLMNSAVTSAIENLEFWFVTPGGTFEVPHSSGIAFGSYPDGAILLFDVDSADTRVVNCVFQHSPAAIRIKDVTAREQKRPDGWAGNRGVGIFVENCEFDTACTHVYATNSEVDLQFKGCQFFGGMHRFEKCTGNVVYQSGRWHGSAFIDAATQPNSFNRFVVKSADVEIGAAPPFIALNRAQLIDISQNTVLGGVSGRNWLEVYDADGGCIVSNAINNSRANASAGQTSEDFTAAIKLTGCRHVLIASNNVTATDFSAYGGFGILSVNGSRTAYRNFINGNAITAPYTGAKFMGVNRYINVRADDIVGVNYTP